MTLVTSDLSLDELLRRSARLERELREVEQAMGPVAAGTRRPGLHLVVEAGGHRAVLPAASVVQIARLVAFTPIPGAPPAVLGAFVRRGVPGVALDLAAILGVLREPGLDAHLVVFGGVRHCAVLVDEVQQLVEGPTRVDGRAERLLPAFGAELVAGWCDLGGWVVPLLSLPDLERLALGGAGAPPLSPRGDQP